MTQAKEGDTVQVEYTGKLSDGTVFDTTQDQPMQFTIGEGDIIPGFEDAVKGMEPGESKTTTIPADEAYGERRDDMVLTVNRDQFPQDIDLEAGQRFQIVQPDGTAFLVTIRDISESKVTLDANHPLAGKDLTFDIKLVKIV